MFWLPFEDNGPRIPLTLGILIAFTLGVWLMENVLGKANIPTLVGYSMLVAGTPVFASSLLMIFKSGLHNHGFPDFPISDLLYILNFLPLAIPLGIGLAFAYDRFG